MNKEMPEKYFKIENNILQGFDKENDDVKNKKHWECDIWTIPDAVLSIEKESFMFYHSKSSIEQNIRIFFNKKIDEIGDSAFFKVQGLSIINFSKSGSLRTIGVAAFYGCTKLISLTLPKSIRFIKKHAFCGCALITEIICDIDDINEIELGISAFEEVCSNGILINKGRCPANKVLEYFKDEGKLSDGWSAKNEK